MDQTPKTFQELQEEWLTIPQLTQAIGLARDTQAHYRSEGKLPFYKVGRRILYKASEINEWIDAHKVVHHAR